MFVCHLLYAFSFHQIPGPGDWGKEEKMLETWNLDLSFWFLWCLHSDSRFFFPQCRHVLLSLPLVNSKFMILLIMMSLWIFYVCDFKSSVREIMNMKFHKDYFKVLHQTDLEISARSSINRNKLLISDILLLLKEEKTHIDFPSLLCSVSLFTHTCLCTSVLRLEFLSVFRVTWSAIARISLEE